MNIDSIYFKGHRCFKREFSGLDEVKPINVIIGRNNTGKTQFLDFVAALCQSDFYQDWEYECHGTLEEESLQRVFTKGPKPIGNYPGSWWEDNGRHFLGVEVVWNIDNIGEPNSIRFPNIKKNHPYYVCRPFQKAYLENIKKILSNAKHSLKFKIFKRLLADRDIQPEVAETGLTLDADGSGATNVIRRYITTSNEKYPRELVQTELLEALNTIFMGDGKFTEIQVRIHDEPDEDSLQKDHWEIYLGEEKKGLIALSKSGSGLKTIILVLLNLLTIPQSLEKDRNQFVFAFEELENNLHPSLLRRLFHYIEEYATKEGTPIFITTHSSVALDYFGLSDHAQIIHVKHDGESATASVVQAHFDKCGVVTELGAKPSDLLQANGIIWVEGPSDRIYLNRWIEILSKGQLKEGRDYQCAFYGGALLARTEFSSPEDQKREENRVNLLSINPNIVLVCDGDRSEGGSIKDRVKRIKKEVKKIPEAHLWITTGREIENYVPGSIIGEVQDLNNIPDPGQYQHFFPRKRITIPSFIEKHLNLKSLDKVQFAINCVEQMDLDSMKSRFDWFKEMSTIVEHIRKWNA